MKILKVLLLFVVSLIILLLVVALFVNKEIAVEREITIAKPNKEVFEYIKHVKNQDNYAVWNKKDPNSKKTYTGTDGTVGFVATWNSENKEVGMGEQEIKKIVDGERMEVELRMKKPIDATDNVYFITVGVDSLHTTVKWGLTGKMPYPLNLMGLVVNMNEMLGKDLSGGLANLKEVLEK